ncbi:MAG: phosphotransferase [Gemmatimonadetes bacterium]|nr:phosphotransferase [Gemmatimonadota bacterium]
MTTRDVENLLVRLGLDHGRVHLISGGWSYWTFEVELRGQGGQDESFEPGWIFRFPRNSVVAGNLQKEQAVLPVVASRVAFDVPRFEHVGTWHDQPYAGYRRIPGRPLSGHPLTGSKLADEAAGSIAEALSSLHDIRTSLVAEVCAVEPTVDAWRRRYHELRDTVRARVSPLLDSRVLEAVECGFNRFLDEELATLNDIALVHCDLGCEHILIGDDGKTVTGLIDFEDVTIGDPAIDFVGIFVTYGMEAVERIRDYYQRALDVQRTLDERFEQRLRFYTWMASCHEILYGLEEGREDLVEDGIKGLRIRLGHAGLL